MVIDKNKWIVITGGAGFIGASLVRYLNDQGISNLILVDHLGHSEKWKNLVGKQFLDLLDKTALWPWLEGKADKIQAFIHLGACSSTTETDASYLLENNYRYSIKLAEYALQHQHRFIYASSAATYGDGLLGFADDETQLNKLQPLNMYGYSKHLFDLWLQHQGLLDKVTGLKFFNVFGPNEYHKGRMASAIVATLVQAQQTGSIKLFKSSDPKQVADGEQRRDFIYVKDVVRLITAFLENTATGIYNIGSGIATSWNSLAQAVFKAMNASSVIEYKDMPKELVGKYQNYTCADCRKMHQVLGKAANCWPFEQAVIDYVQQYLIVGKTW